MKSVMLGSGKSKAMKEIILNSKRHGIKSFIIDDEDTELIMSYNWSVDKRPRSNKYVAIGYKILGDRKNRILMHRLVLGLGYFEKIMVDHIDQNTQNNQKVNLRLATNAQNQFNRGKTMDSLNEYKGIRKNGSATWGAILHCGKMTYTKGGFKTQTEAAMAYNELAIQHHGEFACLNEV